MRNTLLIWVLTLTKKKEHKYAEELIATLGQLPLAIAQAGVFIYTQNSANPIKSYLEIYHRISIEILAQQPTAPARDYGNKTVFITWEISFAAVQRSSPQTAELLLICGFLNKDDV